MNLLNKYLRAGLVDLEGSANNHIGDLTTISQTITSEKTVMFVKQTNKNYLATGVKFNGSFENQGCFEYTW